MDIPDKEDSIDKTKKGECTMCKFVLIFALVVLLLVLVFTFYIRSKPATPILEPLAPELVQPLDHEAERQQLLNLGGILHPGLAASATPSVPSPAISTQKTVTTHE